MHLHIRPIRANDIEDVVQLSLAAWEPVFHSFRQTLGSEIYAHIYPDWRTQQSRSVEQVCNGGEKTIVLVAEVERKVAGFIAYELHHEDKRGEVQLLAVHTDYQNQGIGTALNIYVLERMKEQGMTLASVSTGGDPSHAPARRSYEKAGYTA